MTVNYDHLEKLFSYKISIAKDLVYIVLRERKGGNSKTGNLLMK
jgi:hypothetical protein